jgi:hypothetical protein
MKKTTTVVKVLLVAKALIAIILIANHTMQRVKK